MEADTPEQFPRYGQYPSLCSADPLPLEILRAYTCALQRSAPGLSLVHSRPQSHSTLFLTEITWPKETTGCGDENGLDIAS